MSGSPSTVIVALVGLSPSGSTSSKTIVLSNPVGIPSSDWVMVNRTVPSGCTSLLPTTAFTGFCRVVMMPLNCMVQKKSFFVK